MKCKLISKAVSLLLAGLMTIMMIPVSAETAAAGTYAGSAPGFGGDVTVAITVDAEGKITDVNIDAPNETPALGGAAIQPLKEQILSRQSAEIDAVAGATITSDAVVTALTQALNQAAGIDAAAEMTYQPGSYQGTAMGRIDNVTVEVEVSEHEILSVNIVADRETAGVADPAKDKIPADIVKYQSLGIDTVAGATVTSHAILNAVSDALKQAGADVVTLRTVPAEAEAVRTEDQSCQILVVGGGMAGMMAAIAAADAGADVMLLEKLPYLGGSVVYAAGAYQVSASKVLDEQGIPNSVESALADIHYVQDPSARQPDYEFVEYMLNQVGPMFDYLVTDLETPYVAGIPATDLTPAVAMVGGELMGAGLVQHLQKKMTEKGVRILTNAAGVRLILEDGKVTGVTAESNGSEFTVRAEQTILATGGSGADRLIEKTPALSVTGLDNQASAGDTGDGFSMLEEIGAQFGEGPYVKTANAVLPVSLHLTWVDAPTPANYMVVDTEGKRFFCETNALDGMGMSVTFTTGMINHGSPNYYMLFDAHNVDSTLVEKMNAVANQEGSGVWKADHIDELSALVNAPSLAETYAAYQDACSTGVDAMGKDQAHLIAYNDDQGLYAVKVIPGAFGSLGGVMTDEQFHVLLSDGTCMQNLYAVGELATSTLYGEYYNGFSLSYYSAAGKIAGETAAASLK